MTTFMTDFVQHYGYLAVFVLMVLESACIPIPSEVTMVFGGALANAAFVATLTGTVHHLNFVAVGLVGTLGNLVGSYLAYWVGRVGGRPLVERWGKVIFLREHDLDRAEAWWARRGQVAVFLARLLPAFRTFISLPAGIGEMPLGTFTLYTILGCLPWTFALAGAGYALGGNWDTVVRNFKLFTVAGGALLLAVVVWWLARHARARREASTRPA